MNILIVKIYLYALNATQKLTSKCFLTNKMVVTTVRVYPIAIHYYYLGDGLFSQYIAMAEIFSHVPPIFWAPRGARAILPATNNPLINQQPEGSRFRV